jgi:hypothetical protein
LRGGFTEPPSQALSTYEQDELNRLGGDFNQLAQVIETWAREASDLQFDANDKGPEADLLRVLKLLLILRADDYRNHRLPNEQKYRTIL